MLSCPECGTTCIAQTQGSYRCSQCGYQAGEDAFRGSSYKTFEVSGPEIPNKVMQSLWIGKMTAMEQLCIRSFQANGHEFHLYTYDNLEGVPPGTVIKDGNEILPKEQIRRFRNIAQFSNFFYYTLLLKKGGWWTDMDNVCLKHFDFSSDYVFYQDADESTISFAVAKAPAETPIMRYCYDFVSSLTQEQVSKLSYQEIGPNLTARVVPQFKLTKFVQPGIVFDPIHWSRTSKLVDPSAVWDLSKSYSLHLFHGAWNNGPEAHAHSSSPSTEKEYPEGCLYEQLKRRYLTYSPYVSIVLTTFNRPTQLNITLQSISKQNFPNLEIIVVDDGADEKTEGICRSYGAEYIKINRPLTDVVRTPALPNNIGIRHARGDVIILQNAECKHVDPSTIEKLVSSVTDTNVVFAKVYALNPEGQITDLYCGKSNPRPFFFCGAIKKFWLEKIRGFDEEYTDSGYDDDDLGARLQKEGVAFNFTDIEVHHQWHPSGGRIDIGRMQQMYISKCAAMGAGTLGTARNLGREWGAL
jgi:Glycosyl transferase family 2